MNESQPSTSSRSRSFEDMLWYWRNISSLFEYSGLIAGKNLDQFLHRDKTVYYGIDARVI